MAGSSPMGRKHCGKTRTCSLRVPFPTVFSKELYCRHLKPGLVWEKDKSAFSQGP